MNKKHIILGSLVLPLTGLTNEIESEAFFNLDKIKIESRLNKATKSVANIEDENLLKAINVQLGRGEVLSEVTMDDLKSLTTLNANNRNIISLKGLEDATNLTTLDLSENKIVDVSYLSSLTSLKTLYLYDNQIEIIVGLDNLVNLEKLYLGQHAKRGNPVDDLTPIKDLSKIKVLHIGRTGVRDLNTLSNLTSLTELYIECNELESLSGIENLVNLKILDFHGNNIETIEEVRNLINLTHLYGGREYNYYGSWIGYGNQIIDISPLENLTSLRYLHLGSNKISDISSLENLTSLKELYLHNNQISGISVLENLTSLNTLYLHNNQISDMSPLENLTYLTYLHLSNNQISDISPLESSTSLKELYLHNNQISGISVLENLTSLNMLYAYNNHISDISPLENLTSLNTLYLNNNKISDISSLENLTSLTYLHLANNKISDILPLENLTSLTYLHLANNQISDISPLENLTSLNTLYLHGNQISDISPLRSLNNLITLRLENQKPNINTSDFKTGNDTLNIKINNPIIGLNDNFTVSNISNGGVYENSKFKWDNLSLGSYTNSFNFSQDVRIGSASTIFNGIATINFDIKKGEPDYTYSPEFDENSSRMYITLTNDDLGEDASHIIHREIRHSLPYRFEYDSDNLSNNIIEVLDTLGNIEEYQIKLNENDIPEIEVGVDYLASKTDLTSSDIKYFRDIINGLDESLNKDLLQDKLNSLFPDITLDRETVSANVDVYIKSENMLSMSLDTNSVSFENYSGAEPMEKVSAINITVNSSLPYNINAYLPTEISNSDKSNKMDLSIFNIKEGSENTYKQFSNNTDKIVLKENCVKGNDIKHSIDLKLDSSNAHKTDVYKTTIKFEIEQN